MKLSAAEILAAQKCSPINFINHWFSEVHSICKFGNLNMFECIIKFYQIHAQNANCTRTKFFVCLHVFCTRTVSRNLILNITFI
jgi:hypothetical protein